MPPKIIEFEISFIKKLTAIESEILSVPPNRLAAGYITKARKSRHPFSRTGGGSARGSERHEGSERLGMRPGGAAKRISRLLAF
jgi:hypothetical protein